MTIANFFGVFSSVCLYSSEWFGLVKSFRWAILIMTVILHIISFYFYRNYQNKKLAEALNRKVKFISSALYLDLDIKKSLHNHQVNYGIPSDNYGGIVASERGQSPFSGRFYLCNAIPLNNLSTCVFLPRMVTPTKSKSAVLNLAIVARLSSSL